MPPQNTRCAVTRFGVFAGGGAGIPAFGIGAGLPEGLAGFSGWLGGCRSTPPQNACGAVTRLGFFVEGGEGICRRRVLPALSGRRLLRCGMAGEG